MFEDYESDPRAPATDSHVRHAQGALLSLHSINIPGVDAESRPLGLSRSPADLRKEWIDRFQWTSCPQFDTPRPPPVSASEQSLDEDSTATNPAARWQIRVQFSWFALSISQLYEGA